MPNTIAGLQKLGMDGMKRIQASMVKLNIVHGESKPEEWYDKQRDSLMQALTDEIREYRKGIPIEELKAAEVKFAQEQQVH